jgi:hypothetical protein
MPGNLEKKKLEIKKELEDQPNVFVDTRIDVIKKLTLAREFSETYMAALTKSFGGHNIPALCQLLGKQRALLMGYTTSTMRSFNLPSAESVNSALILTEPNTSVFGYACTDVGENNTIFLSNTSTDTQTISNSSITNTFSVYVGDYYLIRYRESGELVSIDDKKQKAYETPDEDRVFGNAVAYGSSIESEAEANTWNYEFAKCNVASISVLNAGSNTELKVITLADHLAVGSNTEYTPGGPLLGQKFYLKKHSAKVDNYTVTGSVTVNDLVVVDVSDEDIELVNFGDTISGTGIPANTTIAAVQSSLNQIRLSVNATSSGSDLTLSLGHIPLGHDAHDIFAQVEITAEGLVKNEGWSAVGDDDGSYGATHHGADDVLMANTSEFQALLGYFDPASNSDGLIASSRGDISADGKETGGSTSQSGTTIGTVYPQIENLPFKPANAGTNKSAETKDGVLVGTQPSGLTDKDIWAGRHIHWMKDKTSVGPAPAYDAIAEDEYQYLADNATKFFYMVNPLADSSQSAQANSAAVTTVTYQAGHPLPNTAEPRAAAVSTNLTDALANVYAEPTRVVPSATKSAVINIPAEPATPKLTAFTGTSSSGSSYSAPTVSNDAGFFFANTSGSAAPGSPSSSTVAFYGISKANNVLYKLTVTDTTSTTKSPPTAYTAYPPESPSYPGTVPGTTTVAHAFTSAATVFACAYNRAQYMLNSEDHVFAKAKLTSSEVLAVNTTSYDPIVGSTSTANSGSGISDTHFYNNNVSFNSNTSAIEVHQITFSGSNSSSNNFATNGSGPVSSAYRMRSATGDSRSALGALTSYTGYGDVSTAGTWVYYNALVNTFKTKVTARIAELDTRIGIASYSGSPTSGRKNPPAVKVSSIPSANTFNLTNPSSNAMAYIPYGKSIYDSINHALGQHVDVIGGVMRDIQSLTDLVENVKKARNKYEIFSGREKEYTI